ncbi:MAG: RDD family protein, partial [Planctomycetota bacterium]
RTMWGRSMTQPACPLCQKTKTMRRTPKRLYGTPVCRKCYYRFASRRQLAYLVDWIAFYIASFMIGITLVIMFEALQMAWSTQNAILLSLDWVILPLMLFLPKDGIYGYSPGKFICRVRVVHRETFNPIGPIASLKRNLILLIPFSPLVVAFLLQKGYRVGDGWAKSKVIWLKYQSHPVFTGGLTCEQCEYDLTGNTTGMCPECGTTFTPPLAPPVAVIDHTCVQCMYNLTGNTTGSCPECGTSFAPPTVPMRAIPPTG